jgi:hypothetical protein
MSYLGAGFVLLAVFGGGTAGGSCQGTVPAAATGPAAVTSPSASAGPSAPAAPAAESVSPVLTQQASGTWTTTVYLNTAALCPAAPSFELVTGSPNDVVVGHPSYQPPVDCSPPASAPRAPLTAVALTFGPCTDLATPPVTAAVVVTPAQAAVPVQIPVTVRRAVSGYQYLWVPVWCGLGLAALLVLTMLVFTLPDPNANRDAGPNAGQSRGADRPDTMSLRELLSRPLYASAAWSFSGSWATNVTTAAAVAGTVLTASGTISELLPGVELGRFSLLIAVAGGITLIAPLVFGALNYRFERVDPTTAGVSVISLPRGPVAVLSGWGWRTWRDRFNHRFRSGAMVVTLPSEDEAPLPDGYKVRLPDKGEWRWKATIMAPAGATMTLFRGADIPASSQDAAPLPEAAFTELPGRSAATLKPGAVLSIPPGATITVSPSDPAAGPRLLALPGASDVTVFAGQQVAIDTQATLAVTDVTMSGPVPSSYRLRQDFTMTVPGGAKISFLGQAMLTLPAGSLVAVPGAGSLDSARRSNLRATTVYPLPHTGQVVASRMWSLLAAAALTLFGTGAELGILGVLVLSLSSASLSVRVLCVAAIAVAALVVWVYSVVSIRALADPMPGDALNATGGTSFML